MISARPEPVLIEPYRMKSGHSANHRETIVRNYLEKLNK